MFHYLFKALILCSLLYISNAWDTEELEIFDLVEEINENFYDVMGISKDAGLTDIKKAYRSLSKQLHPDKNDAPDAEVKFRQLVAVYDVLRDTNRRARYDLVLIEGLPDWRSPIFYYRRARKMSFVEISLILTVVISITQYLMAWGAYWDKRHTQEEILLKKYRIKDRRKKKPEDLENLIIIENELSKIEKPRWWNILPIQIIQFTIFLFTDGPSIIRLMMQDIKERKRRKEEEERWMMEEEERIKEEEEKKKEKRAQLKTRKKVHTLPEYSLEDYPFEASATKQTSLPRVEETIPVITGGPWTDEDFSELARLMAKYPGGTIDRWEKIASLMNRTVFEVTKMSNKVKTELASRNLTGETPEAEPEIKVKQKTRGGKSGLATCDYTEKGDPGSDEHWTPIQQKALEKALKVNPKGTDQRWDKIARCVPEKSKEECMIRFKFLAERIRKKKEQQLSVEQDDDHTEEKPIDEENSHSNQTCESTPLVAEIS